MMTIVTNIVTNTVATCHQVKCFFLVLALVTMSTVPSFAQAQGSGLGLWDLYKNGQFEEVVLQGKALLNTGTETGSLLLAVGRSLADLQRQQEALFFLHRAVAFDKERTWVYAWGQVYLGKCQFHLGALPLATDALILARDCGATRHATNAATELLDQWGLAESYDNWDSVESEHFIIYSSPRTSLSAGTDFVKELEQIYDHQATWFRYDLKRKIRFFLWDNSVEAGLMGLPQLGFSLAEDFVCHVGSGQNGAYELTQVMVRHAINPVVESGLISEGMAVFFTGEKDRFLILAREARLAQAVGMGFAEPIPLSVMSLWLDWGSQTPVVAKPVAGAFVSALILQGGKDRFLAALFDQSPTNFKTIYGEELTVWIKKFEADLNR